MTDSNQQQSGVNHRALESDRFDRELDMALAKFAAVEPRPGLEDRVLASLRAERRRVAEHSWWRWPAVAALAAAIMVAVSLAWKAWKPVQNITTQRPPAIQSQVHTGTLVANNVTSDLIRTHSAGSERQLGRHSDKRAAAKITRAPKLDQFPSPQPLSQQEQMLTEYVAEHHQQAVLVARARMLELKKDLAEEMEEAAAISKPQTSEQSVSQQEDR
jgi:hypothetical protein